MIARDLKLKKRLREKGKDLGRVLILGEVLILAHELAEGIEC